MSVPAEFPTNAASIGPGSPAMAAISRSRVKLRVSAAIAAIAMILFLAFYNLPRYPLTWFDEGSHLHVPKSIVTRGLYADYSSDGPRYFGPTVGVGPTVMLPIAAAFWAFGVGLLQARLVLALYFLRTISSFYRLARLFCPEQLAWVATGLLITSQGITLLEYWRQVLGEVPGFFFLVFGLALLLGNWEHAS